MPVLTGREVTPDFCAIRLLLNGIDPDFNIPSVRLAVWSAYAGLSTRDDLIADLRRVDDLPRLYRRAFTDAEVERLYREVFTKRHPDVERHF